MGEVRVRASTEGSSTKYELVYTDPERPPIDRIGISFLGEDFWSHIGHGSCDACQESAFRIMNSDIEIGQMSVPLFVQENIIRFDVPIFG